jgi:RNA 3'-terminal phosphate cyclase (ATP)
VPISPPWHYLGEVFFPILTEFGVNVDTSIGAYGFYPRGGGEIGAEISPVRGGVLESFVFPGRKAVFGVRGVSAVGNLPLSIAERQKHAALLGLRRLPVSIDIETTSVPTAGAGTFIFLKTEGGACRAAFSSIGIRGKRAETVGTEAAIALLDYYHKEGCLDPHLADQVVLYQALARGKSVFTTTAVTQHLLTNLAVVKQFLDIDYRVEGLLGGPGKVTVEGAAYQRNSAHPPGSDSRRPLAIRSDPG